MTRCWVCASEISDSDGIVCKACASLSLPEQLVLSELIFNGYPITSPDGRTFNQDNVATIRRIR
jgi:hypothetical protein